MIFMRFRGPQALNDTYENAGGLYGSPSSVFFRYYLKSFAISHTPLGLHPPLAARPISVLALWYNLLFNLTQEIAETCPRRLLPSTPAKSSIRAAIPLSRPTFMSEIAREAALLFPPALPPASTKPSSCATATSQNISARAC